MGKNKYSIAGIGICTGVTAVMLVIAYVPWFFPVGYEKLHKSGLIQIVPLITLIQVGSAVAWLYLHNKGADTNE